MKLLFQKGHAGYWLGKKRGHLSDNHKRKISEATKGKIVSSETRSKMSLSSKGKQVRLGMKHTEETKRKIAISNSIAQTGKVLSAEVRRNISLGKRGKYLGKLASNWKGGVTPKNHVIRMTGAYKEWRKSVFERDGYTCVSCGVRGGVLNADHVKAFAHHPESRFDIENGRTLCVPCHRKTDNYGSKANRKAFKKTYGV